MAVQGEARLHAEGVPCAQTGGPGAQLHQPVPQPRSVLAAAVDLVAQRLAGVAGLGHLHLMTLEGQSVQGVLHRLRHLYPAGEGGQQILGLGALHGDGGPPGGDVRDGAVIVLHHGAQMHQILLRVGGVHHQQESLLLEAIEVRIVHGSAVLVRQDAVLGHVQIQPRHVAGQDVLQKCQPLRPLDQQPPHVGHIEQAAEVPGVQMLRHDSRGILDGHFPSAEIHHGGTGRHMGLVQLGAFEFAHVPSSLSCLFRCLFRLFCSVCFVCPVAGHIPDASRTGLGGALDTFRKGFGRTKRRKTAFGSFAPPFLYLRDSPPERVAPSACGQAALFGVSSWSDPFA